MQEHRRERGTVMTIAVFAMLALLGVAAFSIDIGVIMVARTELQNAADSAALAGMKALRDTGNQGAAKAAAKALASENRAGGAAVELSGTDVKIGSFNFDSSEFSESLSSGVPAIEVVARRTSGFGAGPLPLFFGSVLGRTTVNVSAKAVAAIRLRNLVIVQDRTGSFEGEFSFAQDADKDLIEAMANQSIAGDRVGLVTFARDFGDGVTEYPMTTLTVGGKQSLQMAVDDFTVCSTVPEPAPFTGCWGTDIAAGIDAASDLLDPEADDDGAEQVIVIVSDGLPCITEEIWDAVTAGEELATTAANEAAALGINIFIITLAPEDTGVEEEVTLENLCFGSDVSFNESLARGYGTGFTTTEPEDLDNILISILREMEYHLVQ